MDTLKGFQTVKEDYHSHGPGCTGNSFCSACQPPEARKLLGKLAICSKGRIGIILGRKELPWGLSWVGKGIDGSDWASRDPVMLENMITKLDADLLKAEFFPVLPIFDEDDDLE